MRLYKEKIEWSMHQEERETQAGTFLITLSSKPELMPLKELI